MTTETFIIEIREKGSVQTASAIERVGKAAEHSANIMGFFRSALVAFASIRVAGHLIEFADSVVNLDNRLRASTKSAEEFARAQKFIFEMSRETRTEVGANAVIYGRLLRATQDLKFGATDLESIMRVLAKTIQIGGATSQEAKNALIQFSQSLASGALRGDELRSVAEQIPDLLRAIGKEFGKTAGQMIAFAKANPGILETNKVLLGVLHAAAETDRKFAQLTPTMASGFNVISNAAKSLIHEVNDGTNIFGGFAQALIFIGDHLKAVITIIASFVAIKLADNVVNMTAAFVEANNVLLRYIVTGRIATAVQYAFNLAVSTNPYAAVAIAIIAFIAVLVTLYQTVPQVSAFFNAQWELLKQIGAWVLSVFTPVWTAVKLAMDVVGEAATALWGAFSHGIDAIAAVLASLRPFWEALEPLRQALSALSPLLTALGYVIMGTLIAALTALVFAIHGVTEVLHQLGFVSDETNQKIRDSSVAYYAYIAGLVTGNPTIDAAIAKQGELGKALGVAGTATGDTATKVGLFNDGLDAMGQAVIKPASVLDSMTKPLTTIADKTDQAVLAFSGMGDGLAKVDTVSVKAMNAFLKLNPEIDNSATAASDAVDPYNESATAIGGITKAANEAVTALKNLKIAQDAAGAGGGQAKISGLMKPEGFALGGSVIAGRTILVGEQGPELFTPNSGGTIIPNHELLGGVGSAMFAANDNSSSSKVVKAIDSVAVAVLKMTNIMDSSYASVKYVSGNLIDRIDKLPGVSVNADGGFHTNNVANLIGGTRKDGSVPLPGDADYVSAPVFTAKVIHAKGVAATYDSGVGLYTGAVDKNAPMGNEVFQAQGYQALFGGHGGDDAVAQQEAMIAALKQIRDNTAAFAAFKEDLKVQKAAGGPKIDFQTLLPILGLGGKDYGEHDPYGFMHYKEGNSTPAAATPVAGVSTDTSDDHNKAPRITMNVFAKDAQSFRENQAQIESRVYGMVRRAQRRVTS